MSSSITEAIGMTAYRAGSNASLSALYRQRGASPAPVFTANSPSGAVTWSDGGAGGSFALSGSGNSIAAYTPANQTAAVVISATDGANTHTKSLTVFGTMPVNPQIGFETEFDIETKVKMARDRTRYFREDGSVEIGWVMGWINRQNDERAELVNFWAWHRKSKQFYIIDTESNYMNLVWFNSTIKAVPSGANRWALSATFRGIFQNVAAPA